MNKTILASSVLLLLVTTPLVSAFAHDDYDRHTRNHRKHYQFHSGVGETHARATRTGSPAGENTGPIIELLKICTESSTKIIPIRGMIITHHPAAIGEM